jgi:hypothetical protein
LGSNTHKSVQQTLPGQPKQSRESEDLGNGSKGRNVEFFVGRLIDNVT